MCVLRKAKKVEGASLKVVDGSPVVVMAVNTSRNLRYPRLRKDFRSSGADPRLCGEAYSPSLSWNVMLFPKQYLGTVLTCTAEHCKQERAESDNAHVLTAVEAAE